MYNNLKLLRKTQSIPAEEKPEEGTLHLGQTKISTVVWYEV